MLDLPLGTIIRNTSSMLFGKHDVPANVYLAICSPINKKYEYSARVIKYRKDPSAKYAPNIGFRVLINEYHINNNFEIVSKIVSDVNILKMYDDITSCESKKINTRKSIYTPDDSPILKYSLFVGYSVHYKSLNMYFKIHSSIKSYDGGYPKYTIKISDGKNKMYDMVIRSKKTTISYKNKKLVSLKIKDFNKYFEIIKHH